MFKGEDGKRKRGKEITEVEVKEEEKERKIYWRSVDVRGKGVKEGKLKVTKRVDEGK